MSAPKLFVSFPEELRAALTDAAIKVGLTGAAEYVRVAAFYLIEHQELPPQFVGRRAVMRTGRPAKPYTQEEREEDARVGAALLATAAVTRAQARS